MTPSELRTIRKGLKLTQREMAERLGYRDLMSVSRWERGITPIPDRTAKSVEMLRERDAK